MDLNAYLPIDRLHALARGDCLPAEAYGSALIADISGFTPLTEALVKAWGTRRGAEELTQHLNLIYEILINTVHRYGGSVIAFSGDAILCWFEGEASSRAVQSALELQQAVHAVAEVTVPDGQTLSLAIKTAITTGQVHRYLIGDPEVQLIDTLAGQTISLVSEAEGLASGSELLVDAATAAQSGAVISEWRTNPETGHSFAVVSGLRQAVASQPWPNLPVLDSDLARSWLLPGVYKQLNAGLGEFLTELRPCVALFVNFAGIDFEADPAAEKKLNDFVCHVQHILSRYDASLIQVTIGDKGSYLYTAFGAPVVYEDAAQRAVNTALELLHVPFDLRIKIGMSQGIMRTGVYGSSTRRTYGVLGDNVNMAARLMQMADDGEVLCSGRIQKATKHLYQWEVMTPAQVKGKKDPVSVAWLIGKLQISPDATAFESDLIGRSTELSTLQTFIDPIYAGRFAGIAYVYGEPGIGKSQLIRTLQQQESRNHALNWFTLHTDNLHSQSLQPFADFLREYFQQSPQQTDAENRQAFDTRLAALHDADGKLSELASFLGALLNLTWQDSAYERATPRERFDKTLIGFKAFLEAECRRAPTVLYLDDVHGLDADSLQLLESLLDPRLPLALLITSRYFDDGSHFVLPAGADIPQTAIHLRRLLPDDIALLAAQTLGSTCTSALTSYLVDKTKGNPLFCVQLVLDLRERGILGIDNTGAWSLNGDATSHQEIPSSINLVLVARLDRLEPKVKLTVQTGAILGEEFEVATLRHMLSHDETLTGCIEKAETEAIWSPLNQSQFQFSHGLLRDAAYDMQDRSRLRRLHAQAAAALEALHDQDLPQYAVGLVYHCHHAEEFQRECYYARMAGEYAAGRFANAEAIDYLDRALALTPDSDLDARFQLLLTRESLYDLRGERTQQYEDLGTLAELAQQLEDSEKQAMVALRHANLAEVTGNYEQAVRDAQQVIRQSGELRIQAAAYLCWGRALGWQGKYQPAKEQIERSLEAARTLHLIAMEADGLRNLGIVAYAEGNYSLAEKYQLEALHLSRKIHDQRGESNALNNLGILARVRNDLQGAESYQQQAVLLSQQTGDRRVENSAMLNLGGVVLRYAEFEKQLTHLQEVMHVSKEIGNRRGETIAITNLGELMMEYGDYASALTYYWRALRMCREIGFRRGEETALIALGMLMLHMDDPAEALNYGEQALQVIKETGDRPEQVNALTLVGHASLAANHLSEASNYYQLAITLGQSLDQSALIIDPLAGFACVALAANDLPSARQLIEQTLERLESNAENGAVTPLRVYLTCYKVLHAIEDERAATILDTAIELLQRRAAMLNDPSARRSYLEDVPEHREILAARVWTAHT